MTTQPTAPQAKPAPLIPDEVRRMVVEGETLNKVGFVHQAIYWKGAAVCLLGLLLALVAPPLGIFLLLVGGIVLIAAYIQKINIILFLTDRRVVVRKGVVLQETVQMLLENIESVEIARTIPGQLLGYGSIILTGLGSRVTIVPFISNADEVRAEIDRILFTRKKSAD